jgi:hypothetical protein
MAIANNADQYDPEEFRDKCFRGDDGLVIYDPRNPQAWVQSQMPLSRNDCR